MHHSSTPGVNWQPGLGWFQDSTPAVARNGAGEYRNAGTVISVVPWFMGQARICAGLSTGKSGALYGRRACSHAGRPMSCLSPWPTRRPGSSGACLAAVKHSGLKPRRPHNGRRNKRNCEGDDDVMAKQGDRDGPNPRCCPSLELDSLTGRRSSDSIRARGKDYAASKGRIDDCKPNPPLFIKTTCNLRGVHR